MRNTHFRLWLALFIILGIQLNTTDICAQGYSQQISQNDIADEAIRLIDSWEQSEKLYGKNSIPYADELLKIGRLLKSTGFRPLSHLVMEEAHHIYVGINNKIVAEYNRTGNKKLLKTLDYLKRQRRVALHLICEAISTPYSPEAQGITYEDLAIFFNAAERYVDQKKDPKGWSQSVLRTVRFNIKHGYYNKAISKIRAAQKVTERRFPDEYYQLEYELGICYLSLGDLKMAMYTFFRLKDVVKTRKETYYLYGAICNQLASIHVLQNEYDKAEKYLRIALNEYDKEIPALLQIVDRGTLPYQLSLLCYTANAYEKKGQVEQAAQTYTKSLLYLKRIVTDEWPYLYTETEVLWAIFNPYFKDIKQFAIRNNSYKESAYLLYDSHQISKALFSVPPLQQHAKVDLSTDTRLKALYDELIYRTTNGDTWDADMRKDNFDRARSALKVYHSIRRTLDYKKQKGLLGSFQWPPECQEIVKQLSANDAVINFFLVESTTGKERIYYAQVISQAHPTPILVKICEESSLKRALNTNPEENNQALYRVIWQPLKPYIDKSSNLYIISDGLLHTVSYASLKNGNEYLIDNHYIYNLLILDNLASLKSERSATSHIQKIFLFGGVDFTSMPEKPGLMRGQGFHYLPGSRKEIQEIHTLVKDKWEIELYSAQNASETAFRNIAYKQDVPNVIHISTHGFYLPYVLEKSNQPLNEKKYSSFYDPLIRTGFTLSGANIAWEQSELSPRTDNGILTALEIQAMELKNTELIVLSACNTGVGEVKDGEGVFGLQRAFRYAGVNSMIVTLWEIPDKETAEFMKEFYFQWTSGRTKRRAFMNTQKKMRAKYPNEPQLWGGFQLIE